MAPGNALRDVGIQLWSQGDTVRAIEMMQRAIDWAEAQGFEGSGGSTRRSLVAGALYDMGRFAESQEHIAFFAEANPSSATWVGRLARVNARLGDTATAEQIAERLLEENRTWLRASHTYQAAKIHAVLGNRERALALIRQALNTGNRSWWDMKMAPRDFESLRGYPPFEELIRPKG
jgi:tetratricopeptide (TPR) repeat protein